MHRMVQERLVDSRKTRPADPLTPKVEHTMNRQGDSLAPRRVGKECCFVDGLGLLVVWYRCNRLRYELHLQLRRQTISAIENRKKVSVWYKTPLHWTDLCASSEHGFRRLKFGSTSLLDLLNFASCLSDDASHPAVRDDVPGHTTRLVSGNGNLGRLPKTHLIVTARLPGKLGWSNGSSLIFLTMSP